MSAVRPQDVLLRVGGRGLIDPGGGRLAMAGLKRRVGAGLTPTFTRADATTCATYIDRDGVLRLALANGLRIEWVDLDGDGVRETPTLLLEGSRTNLVLQSQNFGTTWVVAGTPTRTPAALTLGVLVLDLIGDDSGAAPEGYTQAITITGDGTKAVSLFAKAGPATPAAGDVVIFNDTTAVAERMRATITWTAGVPSVVMSSGGVQIRAPELISDGVYRFYWQAVGVVAANTNRIEVFAASTAGTGDVYVGGVQVENAAFPSSYIPTTTATVTRAADSLTVPFNFGPVDLTVLARLARPVHADVVGSTGSFAHRVLYLGAEAPSSGGGLTLRIENATRAFNGIIDTPTTDANAGGAIPAGAELATAVQFRNLGTGGMAKIDVGTGYGSDSAVASAFSAFESQTLRIGGNAAGGGELYGGLIDVIIARGLWSRAEMLEIP